MLALPALLLYGLLDKSREIFSMPEGFYPLESIFLLLALMALGRIPSLESLRYVAPGEWGKLIGLDRIPEVRTLRQKLSELCSQRGRVEWKPEAEVVMHRTEFWETFRDCLAKLPQRIADVFMLREMEEMKTSQICEALNTSPNNLWVMLHRARMALRECLEINWFKEPQSEGHL